MNYFLKDQENIYIGIRITTDKGIKDLNKKYLKRDYTTDVLSFEIKEILQDPEKTFYLGDVVVNKEQAERQAAEYENDIQHEIAELVEHGVLHLLGIHHEGDE